MGLAWTNPSSGQRGDLNPGPQDYKSAPLTSRPRCLPKVAWTVDVSQSFSSPRAVPVYILTIILFSAAGSKDRSCGCLCSKH